MTGLHEIISSRKTGEEPFHRDGSPLGDKLLSFWQWSSSELVGNALRGVLAEYIVASDLGCVSNVRQEWDAYDIETSNGVKVEVKSSSYIQSWLQEKLSSIKFSIKPTYGWDAKNYIVADSKSRPSDIYVFCVLNHKDKSTVDPMNMEQWDFYILATVVLNQKVGDQASITLASLQKLSPIKAKYGQINNAITHTLKNNKSFK